MNQDSIKRQVRLAIEDINNPQAQQELLRIAGTSKENFSLVLNSLLDLDNFLGLPGSEKIIPEIKSTLIALEGIRCTFNGDSPPFLSTLFSAFVNPRAEKYEKEFHPSVLTRRSVLVADILLLSSRDEKHTASFLNCFAGCACAFESDPSMLYPLVGKLFVDPETNIRAMWILITRIADTNTILSKFDKFFELLAEADLGTVTKNLSRIYYAENLGSPQTKKIAESILVQLAKKPEFLQRILRTSSSCSSRRELYCIILSSTPDGQVQDIRTRKEGPRFRYRYQPDRTERAKHVRRCRRSGQRY